MNSKTCYSSAINENTGGNGTMTAAAAVPMHSELKLNIGCGTSGVTGWCNIDNSPTILLARLPLGRQIFRTPAWPRDVRRIDVLQGLPFPDNSTAYIYSSHLLQGLTYAQCLGLMTDAWRVLRRSGVLRVVVPDLEKVVKDYLTDPDPFASHKMVRRLSLKGNAIRDLLRKGRRYEQMFDGRSLARLFINAGFKSPTVCSFRESSISDIAAIELEQRRNESLYVEAYKF